MKVVFASTPNQDDKIKELVEYFYTNIFPNYFADKEIEEFEELKILECVNNNEIYITTLKGAYQVIASLQTLISILEGPFPKREYEPIFTKNVKILAGFGIYFPFDFENFSTSYLQGEDNLSVYTKAHNTLII